MSVILVRPASRASVTTDVELLVRVARGDLSALGELYDRYARDVWRVAQRMLGSANDAEDVVHAVFMKLPQIAASHDGRSNVRSWLLGITVRIASRHRRGAGRLLKMIASFAKTFSSTS
ncbi:MAG: sigma factor, partial [Polyangiaceae bacterium]